MKVKKIKALLLALMLSALLFLTGCGADINVYEQQDEDSWYFLIEFELENKLVSSLEEHASFSDIHNRTWTVEKWLEDYFEVISDFGRYEYHYDGITEPVGTTKKVYTFSVTVSKTESGEEIRSALEYDAKISQKTNLFVRTINVVRDNRFDWWIREFEEVKERFDSSSPVPGDGASAMGIFLFGSTVIAGEDTYEELPGFCKAFPSVDLDSYVDTDLHNFWCASRKMNVSYDDKVLIVDDYGMVDRNYVYYVFDKKAGDGATVVEYDYYRADPTGWYLVALAAGGLTVGIIILCVRLSRKKKPPKPKTQDLFPYDPFKDDGGNVNPFEGY